jgi:hypothetical protein
LDCPEKAKHLTDINLAFELQPGTDRSGSRDHLATLDLVALDASQQQTDVLSSLAFIQRSLELLDCCADALQAIAQPKDFDLLAYGNDTGLCGPHFCTSFGTWKCGRI